MNKKILIIVAVVLAIALGVFAWFYFDVQGYITGEENTQSETETTDKDTSKSTEQIQPKTESPIPAGTPAPSMPRPLEFQK
jgi:uncharacterized protein YxeA